MEKHLPGERLVHFFNREVRRVPLNWQHPLDPQYGPEVSNRYSSLISRERIEDRTEPIDESYLMPDFSAIPEAEMGISAYETTSDTPISPVFPDTPKGRYELAVHCTENATLSGDLRGSIEVWSAVLSTDGNGFIDLNTGAVEIQSKI